MPSLTELEEEWKRGDRALRKVFQWSRGILIVLLAAYFLMPRADYSYAQSLSSLMNPDQQAVWKTVMGQVNGLDKKLDALIQKKPPPTPMPRAPWETAPTGRQLADVHTLMLDGGVLRLVSDEDRTLEPNAYLMLAYEKDLVNRTWCIKAYNNRQMEVASYCPKR